MLVLVHLLYTWLTAALLSLVLHAVGCGCQPEIENVHVRLVRNTASQSTYSDFQQHPPDACIDIPSACCPLVLHSLCSKRPLRRLMPGMRQRCSAASWWALRQPETLRCSG